jgi:uncharacterized coiled-coil protein SlyX
MRERIAGVEKRIGATETALADCNVRIADAERKLTKLRAGIPPLHDRTEEREDRSDGGDLVAFDGDHRRKKSV